MIDFQRKILADRVRNEAFHEALRRTIVPGKSIVCDLGSGTGFLAFLASKLGAKEVMLIEQDPSALALSKRLAKENGITSCRFIGRHSSETKNIRADIVVSETLGSFALEEHLIENMRDARNFLLPGGTLMPLSLSQCVCPVISEAPLEDIDTWKVGFGLTFKSAREIGLQNMYVKKISPRDLLPGGTQEWDRFDFRKEEPSVRSAEIHWTLGKKTIVTGFALSWKCSLIPGVEISTKPDAPPTHWDQVFLPLMEHVHSEKGESVTLSLRSDTRHETGLQVTWTCTWHDAHGKQKHMQKLDSLRGQG